MRFEFETRVPAPTEEVYRFHASPANLALLLEGWDGFRLLRHDGGAEVGSTTWVRQTIARALPVVMGFRHTICEPPHRLAEEMLHGPFRRFEHVHEFERSGEGTRVRDRLTVSVPWWYGGEPATRIAIAPFIERLFAFRHRRFGELVRAGAIGGA